MNQDHIKFIFSYYSSKKYEMIAYFSIVHDTIIIVRLPPMHTARQWNYREYSLLHMIKMCICFYKGSFNV